MAFGMNKIKNKTKKKSNENIKDTKVQVSFTIPASFMQKLNKSAKKGTKTKVVELALEKVYDYEKKEFKFDSESCPKDQKVTLNTRLDKDMAKAYKKLAKELNKTSGDLLLEIFEYLENNKDNESKNPQHL